MADVTLRIGGFDTRIGCADGDEPRLRALGAMVDEQARLARQLDPGCTEARMLLMAALMLADALGEARAAAGVAADPRPGPDAADDLDALEAHARRLEALADRWGARGAS